MIQKFGNEYFYNNFFEITNLTKNFETEILELEFWKRNFETELLKQEFLEQEFWNKNFDTRFFETALRWADPRIRADLEAIRQISKIT